jgi:hypothetical protein
MANAFYPKYLENLLEADIDIPVDNIKIVLVDLGAYTYSAAHEFLSDIPVGARIATSGNLANKTITSGVVDADNVTFSAVTGASVEAYVVYQDTGVAATSRLIIFVDAATGLPVTPNGGDITLTWDASGIYAQ